MCESLGNKAKSLKRIRIMNIKLDVPVGKYREFTKEELLELNDYRKVFKNIRLIKTPC